MLTQATYTLSADSPTTVVLPTIDAGHYLLKNIQPHASGESLSRQGYVYTYADTFTVVGNGSANFSFTTGDTGAQIEFYQITTTTEDIKAELLEGATITTTGNPIPAYNLNRNFPDNHQSVLQAATAITGGTAVTREFLSGTNQSGSAMQFDKVITLEPNTQYGFKFSAVGNQNSTVFFEVGWSELYNGYQDIWLGTPNESFVLRGGEEIQFKLFPGESIHATGGHTGARLSVIRQD